MISCGFFLRVAEDVYGLFFGYAVFNFFSWISTPLKRFRVASSFVLEKIFFVHFSVIQYLICFFAFNLLKRFRLVVSFVLEMTCLV